VFYAGGRRLVIVFAAGGAPGAVLQAQKAKFLNIIFG
jgi:hypothetical protein